MKNAEKENYLSTYKILNITIIRLREQIKISENKKDYYLAKIKEAEEKREKIENDIENLKNPVEREVLFLRYLCNKTAEETAEMLNYSYRHIGRIQSSAIENLKIS